MSNLLSRSNLLCGALCELAPLEIGTTQISDRIQPWLNQLDQNQISLARSRFDAAVSSGKLPEIVKNILAQVPDLSPGRLRALINELVQIPAVSEIVGSLPAGLNLADCILQDCTLPVPPPPIWTKPDFNGDGQVDLLWRDYTTGSNTVWLMQGATSQAVIELPIVPDVQWRIQGVADFNQDGQSDILWQHDGTGAVGIWFMQGTAVTGMNQIPTDLTDSNASWQIQGLGDLNGDGQSDILWRNQTTGANRVWLMQGSDVLRTEILPESIGANLRIQGTGDFNGDGQKDIVWRNYLSGETTIWLMQGTQRLGIQSLPTVSDVNWQIQGVVDFNQDGNPDIIWRQVQSGENYLWQMQGTTVQSAIALPTEPNLQAQLHRQTPLVPNEAVFSNLVFSGREGDIGTLQIQLNQAPTSDVVVTLATGAWLTVDADGLVQNGTQSSLIFTPENWNQPRTVRFVAEKDDTSTDRSSNTISYSLSGGLTDSGVYELGTVVNTYAPDLNAFNIDLDFRNDFTGFWTPARQAIAQAAANDWSRAIANEWTGFSLDNSINLLDSATTLQYSFASRRYVDDLVVFVNDYTSVGLEPAIGGPTYEFGGWITTPTELMPRVGQIAISSALLTGQSDLILYQVVAHEIGHTLGLLGLNWIGYSLQDRSNPQTATFLGEYSREANGGNYVPLYSQNGGDFAHPGNDVRSIMSYGWIYDPRTTSPTLVDYAMLADSGYQIYGINYGGPVVPS